MGLMRIQVGAEKLIDPVGTAHALIDVADERNAQDERWGLQSHGDLKWLGILAEEFGEVAKQVSSDNAEPGALQRLRRELLQVGAVACAWVECLDRQVGADMRARGVATRREIDKLTGAPLLVDDPSEGVGDREHVMTAEQAEREARDAEDRDREAEAERHV